MSDMQGFGHSLYKELKCESLL